MEKDSMPKTGYQPGTEHVVKGEVENIDQIVRGKPSLGKIGTGESLQEASIA